MTILIKNRNFFPPPCV